MASKANSRGSAGKGTFIPVILSFLFTALSWSGYRLFLEGYLKGFADANTMIWIEVAFKLLLFVVPAFFMMNMYKSELDTPVKSLFGSSDCTMLYACVITLAFAMFYAIGKLFRNMPSGYNFNKITFSTLITTVLLAGITEEIFFRGWILNTLMKKWDFIYANILTALLFTVIHYPIWYVDNKFENGNIIQSSIQVFVIGYFLGYIAYKERSIWGAIFTHCMHNIIVTALV